jgi:hypothetical protein
MKSFTALDANTKIAANMKANSKMAFLMVRVCATAMESTVMAALKMGI